MSPIRDFPGIEVYNSVGGTSYFERLLTEWKNSGARVVSHRAISEADYRASRGRLGRLHLRWQMYPGYARICWNGTRGSPKGSPIRVVTTNPFFAPSLVEWAARGTGTTINLLYDLYPDALVQAGATGPDSMLARFCARITRFSLRECAATVFLGDRLRSHAEAAYGPSRRGVVIPVGADGNPFRSARPGPLGAGDLPRILYCGQMGCMHEIETLAIGWERNPNPGIEWRFHAGGSGYVRLRTAAGAPAGVVWGDPLPQREWEQAMIQAQVALVTIAKGAERVVMPSKTYSAMVAGQAILAVCPRESDLADLVARHDCGWVVEPGDVDGLNKVLIGIVQAPGEVLVKRRNAFEAGHREYDMGVVANAWMKLFYELTGGGATAGRGEVVLDENAKA